MLTQSLAAAAALAAISAEEPDWRATYLSDLDAIRDTILTHHPGPVDADNPAFAAWLEDGYLAARTRADAIDSQLAYFYGLSAFVDGFRDGHLGLSYGFENHYFAWPGFAAAWRGGAVTVLDSDPSFETAPPAGARLVSCDGRPAEDWIHARVFDFMMDPALPSDWYRAVPRAFLSRGNPLAPTPRECVFEHQGQSLTLALDWRETDGDTFMTVYRAGGFGAPGGAAITEFGEDRFWVSLPTFGPGGELAETMTAMWERMRDEPESFRNADLVVFDLRGNGGGASMWGDRFETALFGNSRQPAPEGVYVDWRATAGNRDHIAEIADTFILEQFGEDSEAMRWARRVIDGLDGAIARGEPLWTQHPDPQAAGDESPSAAPETIAARVAVLTDGSCASACLDFMDRLMARPGVVHLGAPTSADTQYMEVRTVTLPSGAARLTFAQKVYRGRARGAGVYYDPHIAFDGPLWTGDALRAWVTELRETGRLDR
ncbi:MAG: hypothetical protein KIS81_06580 [Maricaulaceae bacterium]|nr:hypothetical protein [Maricaulaceae bacterium]